ncbi:MAG: response regulator [Stomatobaculum sp.]|nr:response regulator [Stomatobaculum sp.]
MNSKILIVDDDRIMLDVMEQALEPYYEILSAVSGSEALRLLRSACAAGTALPDLILLDIDMPGMNGYEVLEQLARHEDLKKIPVVFLTGLTDEQAEMKGLSRNVLDYLKKPVGMRVLLMRVQHYLNLTAARRDTGVLDQEMLSSLPEALTEREQEVAALMAQFRSDREISEMLNISMPYAKKLVGIVKEKLELEKRGDIRRYIRK